MNLGRTDPWPNILMTPEFLPTLSEGVFWCALKHGCRARCRRLRPSLPGDGICCHSLPRRSRKSLRLGEFSEKLKASGWKCFYIGREMSLTATGRTSGPTMAKLLTRIERVVEKRDCNCIEITGIETSRDSRIQQRPAGCAGTARPEGFGRKRRAGADAGLIIARHK